MPVLTDPSWLLPLPGEDFTDDRLYVLQLGLDWQIDHEPTPIYEHMQMFFWHREMAKLSLAELNRLAKAFHIAPAKKKATAILVMGKVFQIMTDRAVYGSDH